MIVSTHTHYNSCPKVRYQNIYTDKARVKKVIKVYDEEKGKSCAKLVT